MPVSRRSSHIMVMTMGLHPEASDVWACLAHRVEQDHRQAAAISKLFSQP